MESQPSLMTQAFHKGFVGVLEKQGYSKADAYDMIKQSQLGAALGNAARGIWDIGWAFPAWSGAAGLAGGLGTAYLISAEEARREKMKQKFRELDDLLKNQYAVQQYLQRQEEQAAEPYKGLGVL